MIKGIRRYFLPAFHALLLTAFIGCSAAQKTAAPVIQPAQETVRSGINVGFDIDDTLLLSTPAFDEANKSEYSEYSDEWWAIVNKSDEGNSIVKKVAEKILNEHKAKGDEIYIITARDAAGGDVLKNFLNKRFSLKKENVYFEQGKAARIKQLGLSVYYGDSDSDITAAQEAGAKGIRILRSSKSSYKGKYHPGEFKEEIIPNSEE